MGGAHRSGPPLGVVRERRRARCAARRARRVPLGRRRDPARDCRRARARGALRLRLDGRRRRRVSSRSRWRRRSRGRVSASSRRRRRSRASGPWGSRCRRSWPSPCGERPGPRLRRPRRPAPPLPGGGARRARARAPTELASELPVTRQAVSKHLAALADAGLVAPSRAAARPATASRRPRWTRRRPGSSASAARGTTGWQHWPATSYADREAAGAEPGHARPGRGRGQTPDMAVPAPATSRLKPDPASHESDGSSVPRPGPAHPPVTTRPSSSRSLAGAPRPPRAPPLRAGAGPGPGRAARGPARAPDQPPAGGPWGPWAPRLRADPRVDHGVQQIDHEVEDDHRHRGEDDDAHRPGQVEVLDRADGHRAEPGR